MIRLRKRVALTIMVMVAHEEYRKLDWNTLHTPVLVDGRRVVTDSAQDNERIYRNVEHGVR